MIYDLIITIVILAVAGLVYRYAIAPAPFDNVIKWLLSAVGVLIVAVAILKVWGISLGAI